MKELLPVCLGEGHCTNEKAHPPPEEEFCLGCAVCHMESVMVKESTEAEMQAKTAAAAGEAQMSAAMVHNNTDVRTTRTRAERIAGISWEQWVADARTARTGVERIAAEMAEAHEAQMDIAMARILQAVSEGAVTDAAHMEAELLAQVETTEVTESYEARMHEAEQLVGPAGIPEQRMLLQLEVREWN